MKTTRKSKSNGAKRRSKKADGRKLSRVAVKQVSQPISRTRRSPSQPKTGAPGGRALPTIVNKGSTARSAPSDCRASVPDARPRRLTETAYNRTKTGGKLPSSATQETIVNNRSTARSAPSDCRASVPDAHPRRLTETAYKGALGAFNPALPVDGSLIVADELRDQFNGLVGMIQNIPEGPQGPEGPEGPEGPQGPPFAQAITDEVTTLDPGEPAWVSSYFDGSDVHFTFGIPRGDEGVPGEPGPPGEVTTGDLNAAIEGTSNNSNAVDPLQITISDPPTQGEVQAVADKLDELISALRR